MQIKYEVTISLLFILPNCMLVKNIKLLRWPSKQFCMQFPQQVQPVTKNKEHFH